MSFKKQIESLSQSFSTMKNNITNEEGTKQSFILPFINSLGYNIFNPEEVRPEFTADIGNKKGEKVDYAIIKDGKPIILIECKSWNVNLDKHKSQLLRYFNTTSSRFGILTNGFTYQFFSDLESPNVMDLIPFLEFDIDNISDSQMKALELFESDIFDENNIINKAGKLKLSSSIEDVLIKEFDTPSDEFTKLILKQVYPGKVITKTILEQSKEYIVKSCHNIIKTYSDSRLKDALNYDTEEVLKTPSIKEEVKNETKKRNSVVVTTQEELEGYKIIKNILKSNNPNHKISYKDTQSYFGVVIDINGRAKPVCRLFVEGRKKQIELFDSGQKEKMELKDIKDIISYSTRIINTVAQYNI